MTYRGKVRDGVVILEQGGPLPEGTEVRVEPIDDADGTAGLRDALLNLAGTLDGLPADMAENHDHYIHGTPRK